MFSGRRRWLLVTWFVLFLVTTGWVTVEGQVPVANAALVGLVAATAVVALVGGIRK